MCLLGGLPLEDVACWGGLPLGDTLVCVCACWGAYDWEILVQVGAYHREVLVEGAHLHVGLFIDSPL